MFSILWDVVSYVRVSQQVFVSKCVIVTVCRQVEERNLKDDICICRDSEMSSSIGGLKPRLKDYDPGLESGDDLEEEDFSV